MYALESGAAWTPELKNAFKHNVTRASVLYNNVNYNEDNFLKEAELQDVRYVPNVGFLGQAVAKMLTIKLVNDEDSNLNFENANIQFKIGAEYNGTTHYINFGNFIVNEPPENDDTNGTVKVIAYDYMIKFNKSYINRVVYPCTLKDLLLDVCSQAGVDLGSDTFLNENFIVEDNQFEGKQLREVLQHIAKSAFSWARIGQDNKLYLDFQVNNNIDETITIDEYKMDAFKKANEYYGPINKVTYADSDIKGQEISVQDDNSIATNGVKEIIIYDNYFAYTTEKRQQLIQAGSALFGLRYMPIQKLETIGLIYLDSNDIMGIEDGKGTTFLTRNFSHIIKYNGMTNDTFETTGESDNQRTYVNQNNSAIQNARTEITVDRAKKQIQSVVSETIDPNNPNSMSNKLSQVTQTVSELSSQISDIADITTSLETSTAKLQFEDVNQSEPVRVVIHPVGVNIAKLHPHPNLKPKVGLKMTTRILRFQNTTTNETFDYEIPDDLLYYDSENYDEFILDYESLSCVINKKCKWNNDGTVGLLPSERAVEYEFPHIELTEGDYTVSLIKYSNGYLFARMMIKNYYTAQFATRAELNSDIRQTVDNINLSVNEKLTNYSTTTEMNSAIDVKANAITQSVSENYATKTALGNTETSLKSEIKSTAEAITTSVSETYVTNTTLTDKYSTTQETKDMINLTVGEKTKNNLETVTVEYALGTSTTTAPTSGWSTTAPTWQQGKYMWQRTKTKTADGKESTSNPTCIAGAKGQDGTNGTNGVSVSSITEYYAVSSSNTLAPADSAFKTTMQTMTATNKYLWNYEVINFSNSTTQNTNKRVIGTYGDKGQAGTNGTNGKDGIGIKSVTNKYQVSSSNTTAPTSWSDTPQTMTATNKYLWNYEIITYSDSTTTTSKPAVIGTYGDKGDKGNTGNTGKGVKAVVAQYYLSSSKTTQTGGSWAETQPAYKKDYYYWTRTKITWTDNTTTYTTPILVEEINSLNESVASLNIKTNAIETSVTEKVGKTEFGTYITQNKDSVKLAWNQISEYIQMMIINNNASFAILDSSKKPIAYFDKTGIHFSSNNTAFGEMGVQTVDGNKFIAFSVDGKYGQSINNGMAWGIKTTTDNKFHPIFYIKNFEMGSQGSDATFGELVLSASNLVLDGIGTGVVTGGIKIFGDPTAGGIYFYDINKNKYLMNIYPGDNSSVGEIEILDDIIFAQNQQGSHTLRIGRGNNYCLLTDEGYISCNTFYISNGGDGTITGSLWVNGNIHCDGNVYAQNVSDRRLKKNIKDVEDNALDNVKKMKVRSFDWKKDDSHVSYGFIAQELEEIDECYVLKQEIKNDKGEITDYKYYQNEFPIIATLTKAIQEQQAQIEELQKEIKELKGGK